MQYLHSLSPFAVPDQVDSKDQLKIWQERILHTLFMVSALTGAVFFLISYFSSVQSPNWGYLAGYLVFVLMSIVFFGLRKINYWARSIVALALIFAFANLLYFQNGWSGLALMLLLVFSFLSTTLLFQGPSRVGFVLSITTLLFWGTLRLTNLISGIGLASSINSLAIDMLIVLLAGFVVNFSISSLKNHFINTQRQMNTLAVEQNELKGQMKQQTALLERRIGQLHTAAEITRATSSILDSQIMIRQVCESVKDQFSLYYVGVFLVDPMKEFAVLQYGTGEAGRRMLANRHRLAVGGYSMIGWTTQTRKPRIALDIGEEAVHFDNPLLPLTRSELALPITTANNLFGAMTIQSTQQGAFDDEDILVLQSIADSLAIALEKEHAFERTQKALDEIRILNKAYIQQAWGSTLETYGDLNLTYENPDITLSPTDEVKTVKVPLYLRDEVIGEISLEIVGNEMSNEQVEFLNSVSTQTTIALEHARFLEETQRSAAKEQKLNDLSEQFSRSLTIEEILKTAVVEFGKLPSVSEASISLLPPEDFDSRPSLKQPAR
ncbi:MAG: GAF domain-containing protein [Anaerolineaceae bacterium]|nr:GAF domain-containing protein [Anaerolineaceae bacterium]